MYKKCYHIFFILKALRSLTLNFAKPFHKRSEKGGIKGGKDAL